MWYVIQTTSGEEQHCLALCKAKLDKSLYKEMFVPMYVDKMHFKKKWHDVKKVLFPAYFFVDTEDINAVQEEMAHIDRLTKTLRNAEMVAPIREEEQEFLQSLMNSEYVVECSTGFIIGDRVCITEGPLRNHYGFIRKIDRHRRIAKLEINFFGRQTPVEVGLEILARLTEEQFQKLKRDKLESYSQFQTEEKADKDPEETFVRVKTGVFADMQGVLLSKNEKKDEWRVKIELFEYPTEVVFSREEIAIER